MNERRECLLSGEESMRQLMTNLTIRHHDRLGFC
jgi:hypothetical protein